jgi:DNA-directed RNA polymerase beta subunit
MSNANHSNQAFNLGKHISSIYTTLNAVRLNEYLLKEKEILEVNNKIRYQKKSFKDISQNLTSLSNNIDKYFPVPKVKNNEKYVLKISKKL